MLPLDRILCPTDFSEPSFRAVDVAAQLAAHHEAELVLVHVADMVPPMPTPPVLAPPGNSPELFNVAAYQQMIRDNAEQELEAVVAQRLPQGLRVRAVVSSGMAADRIVAAADKEAVGLIVIATLGRTGLRRFVFGSVAERVVRTARCPVLTIPARTDDE